MPDVSIAISARDNFSASIRSIRTAMTPFRKDLEALQGELTTLNRTRVTLRVDADTARRELREARRAFEELGTAESRARYEAAQENYDNLSSSLREVSRQARQTERDITSLTDTHQMSSNQMRGEAPSTAESTSLLGRLGSAGASQFVGQAVSEISSTMLQSAVGQPLATAISSALSGAASGAAIGSMIAPGIGTAVGAALGGVVGTAQGAAQVYAEKDEAFKSYVQDAVTGCRTRKRRRFPTGRRLLHSGKPTLCPFLRFLEIKKPHQTIWGRSKILQTVHHSNMMT